MNTEIMTLEQKQTAWLAKNKLNADMWAALSSSVYPGANPASVLLAVQYCRARNLDPLKRPVHIVPMEIKDAKTGNKEWRDVIMVGINELLATASRTGEFVGKDAPVYGPNVEVFGATVPEYCEVTIWRYVHGQRVAFTAREYFEEACATKKEYKSGQPTGALVANYMWAKRPRGQLAKCALASALRVAFPDEIGGTYAAEEFDGIATEREVAPTAASAAAEMNASLGIVSKTTERETMVQSEEREPEQPRVIDTSPVSDNDIPD